MQCIECAIWMERKGSRQDLNHLGKESGVCRSLGVGFLDDRPYLIHELRVGEVLGKLRRQDETPRLRSACAKDNS